MIFNPHKQEESRQFVAEHGFVVLCKEDNGVMEKLCKQIGIKEFVKAFDHLEILEEIKSQYPLTS